MGIREIAGATRDLAEASQLAQANGPIASVASALHERVKALAPPRAEEVPREHDADSVAPRPPVPGPLRSGQHPEDRGVVVAGCRRAAAAREHVEEAARRLAEEAALSVIAALIGNQGPE